MIKFDISKKKLAWKLVEYKKIIIDIANILVIQNNNCLLFKNNIEYIWVKFMQANKIINRLITKFFTNPNLVYI